MSGNAKGNKTKFIIFKIAENKKEVVLDEASQETDYEVFRNKLESSRDDKGNAAPRYAVYDVEYELPGEGKRYDIIQLVYWCWGRCELTLVYTCRSKIIFISWVPTETPTLVCFPLGFLSWPVVKVVNRKQWSMLYASSRENLKRALNITNSIHADDKSEIEWKAVLAEASGGKAGK